MAFAIAGFEPGGATAKGAASPTLFTYRTTDTIGVVRAAGYFLAVQMLMRKGDLVAVHSAQGTGNDAFHMLVVIATGVLVQLGDLNRGSTAGVGVVARTLNLAALAAANTDLTVAVPNPATILRAGIFTTAAYTGATVTLQLGITVGGAELMAAASIKAQGNVFATLVAPVQSGFAGGTVFARVVQTTPTNVGTGVLILEYLEA